MDEKCFLNDSDLNELINILDKMENFLNETCLSCNTIDCVYENDPGLWKSEEKIRHLKNKLKEIRYIRL